MQKRRIVEIVKNIYGNMPDPFQPTLLVKKALENIIILQEGRHLEKI